VLTNEWRMKVPLKSELLWPSNESSLMAAVSKQTEQADDNEIQTDRACRPYVIAYMMEQFEFIC